MHNEASIEYEILNLKFHHQGDYDLLNICVNALNGVRICESKVVMLNEPVGKL